MKKTKYLEYEYLQKEDRHLLKSICPNCENYQIEDLDPSYLHKIVEGLENICGLCEREYMMKGKIILTAE